MSELHLPKQGASLVLNDFFDSEEDSDQRTTLGNTTESKNEDRIVLCTHQLAACLFSGVSSNRHPKFPEMLQEEGEAVSPSFHFFSLLIP